MNSEVQATLDTLNTSIKSYQDGMDEKFAQLEKDGIPDPVTVDKVAKIETAVNDVQTSLDDALAQIARSSVGSGNNEEDHDVRAEVSQFLNMGRAPNTPRTYEDDVTPDQIEAYQAYEKAWEMFARRGGHHGEMLPSDVQAALSEGSDQDGGFWVPVRQLNRIMKRIHETSTMRGLASSITISGESLEFPLDLEQGVNGGWVSEQQSRPETGTPTVGTHKIDVHELYANPRVTQRILDDAVINVPAWLAGKTGDSMVETQDLAHFNGTGSGQPRGWLTYGTDAVTTADSARAWGVLQYIPIGAAGAFPATSGVPGASDVNAFIDTIVSMKPQYRQGASWLMNRATEGEIRKLKDGDGRYIVGFGDIRDGALGFSMFGFGINNAEAMPAIAADSFSIAFGNFKKAYLIVDRQGIRTLRDPYTAKPFVQFYSTARIGGDMVDFDAIKLVKFSAS